MKNAFPLLLVCFMTLLLASGCSVKRYAVNTFGDMLASGNSVYESDDDIVLIGEALPFSLKLIESMLAESPDHVGLLTAASRGFVLYSYAYVDFEAEQQAQTNLQRARALRARARKLYLRALDYAMRGIEVSYPGFGGDLIRDPQATVDNITVKGPQDNIALLYWGAASLGLAISVSKDDPAMLARLPEVDALLNRALLLDESWNNGALHEFMVSWAASQPGRTDQAKIEMHYQRALELSQGKRASLYLALAEAISIPTQNRSMFRQLMNKALAVDPDADPDHRLVNLIAQRRAQWLLSRIDELFLE